jgi:hypothetical protein
MKNVARKGPISYMKTEKAEIKKSHWHVPL